MKKLLSLVLSVSILISSVTPTLGNSITRGARPAKKISKAGRNGSSHLTNKVSRRILSELNQRKRPLKTSIRNSKALAADILKRPTTQRAPLMRKEFVTLALDSKAITVEQRLEAASHYRAQLKETHAKLQIPENDLDAFLSSQQRTQAAAQIRAVLADASALGLVGTREQASILLDFYKQAQETAFADTATLITARGLLRMEAYDELGALLAENAENPILAGMAEYIKLHDLPVDVPASLQGIAPSSVKSALAAFLEVDFAPNRLHADASLQATEQWMKLGESQLPVSDLDPVDLTTQAEINPLFPQDHFPSFASEPVESSPAPLTTSNTPTSEPQQAQKTSSQPAAQQTLPQQRTTSAAPTQRVSTAASQRAASQSSRSIVLYSGFPVMAFTDALGRLTNWIRNKFKKKTHQEAPYEEPGLHENNARPIYEEVASPEIVRDEEISAAGLDEEMVPIGMDGFKLTIEDENSVEHILHHVDLTVSSSLKNFSPAYNRLALDTRNVFELRNLTRTSKRPDHFYFVLSNSNGEFIALIEGANKLGLSRPLRVKIQRSASPKKTVALRVVYQGGETAVVAEVDLSLLGIKKAEQAEGGWIVAEGNSLYFHKPNGETVALENAFIRLPKQESKYWTKILAMYPKKSFSLGVFSTKDKMPPLTYMVPCLQIGLGKTMSPVLHEMSTLSETQSSYIMFGINNILPALMVFVHPFLKRYGEVSVYRRIGATSFVAGGLVALLSGLYGHVDGEIMSNLQLAGFLTSSTLIALGTNITRYLQNLIMTANRGILPQANSFKKPKVEQTGNVTYNFKHLAKRVKEVFTKKNGESLRDVVFYQRGAMFKNLGTMLFLSFPWLANLAGKAMGVDLGLDFSASYIPYTVFSLYTLYKLSKISYKDSFPLNVTLLRNNLKDLQSSVLPQAADIKPEEIAHDHPVIQEIAKKIKASIDALVPVESRKTKKAASGLTRKYETEAGVALENSLLKKGRTPQQAQAARQALQKAFDAIEHRDVRFRDVIRMVGLPASLSAMALATLGELGLSNGLAFTMRELIGNSTAATGIVGILLYGCMFGWRVIGNFLSQRMSGGSMYALSSTAAILGPLVMALSHGNLTALVTGAIVACFGISNYFSQMYEYIIGLYPKYKREVALLINCTMPVAALGAPLLRLTSGIPGLDMGLAGAAMAASVVLTPEMLANSSVLRVLGQSWRNTKTRIKNFFHRRGNGGDQPPLTENPAQ